MSWTDDESLEELLRRHTVRGPTPELRRRVTGLRTGRSIFWEAAAASLLAGACLVQVVSSRPAVAQVAMPAPDLSAIRDTLRQDFTEEQVWSATLTLSSAAGLRPFPQLETQLAPEANRTWEELQ